MSLLSPLTSQGATGAAGGHLPTAEGEPGGSGGGDGGRHGGAAQTLLALRPETVTTATQNPNVPYCRFVGDVCIYLIE